MQITYETNFVATDQFHGSCLWSQTLHPTYKNWHSLMHERHKFWGFDEMRLTMFIVNWVLKKKALLVFFTLMPSPICFFQENCWGKQDYLSISVNPLSPKNNQHQFSPDISIDNQENRLGELIKWSAEWKS